MAKKSKPKGARAYKAKVEERGMTHTMSRNKPKKSTPKKPTTVMSKARSY